MTSESLLRVEDGTKEFGALVAVNDVDFEIERGEIKSLIGPNGAGKTTLFNCISGTLQFTDGNVVFKDSDITDLRPDEIAHRGLSRSYQINNLFSEFSVAENIRLAAQAQSDESFRLWKDYRSYDGPMETTAEIVGQVGLSEQIEQQASALSHGQKRQLEIGIAMATEPDLLLLDEPTSGLATENIGTIIELIESIREEFTIMLVEHNMEVVMNVSDSIMVMDQGEIIADDSPETIRRSQEVQDAYLGTEDGLFADESGKEINS